MSSQTINATGPAALGMEDMLLGADFFEKLLDSLYDGVYFVDPHRRILFWNRGAERLTGYAQEEMLGRHCFDDTLQHTDEQGCHLCHGARPLMKTIESGVPGKARVYLLHKDQRRIAVDVRVTPLPGAMQKAERLRSIVESCRGEELQGARLSASLGVTEDDLRDTRKSLLARADKALYEAKGKNRVASE